MSNFKIIAKDKLTRAGVLKTAHGEVETPSYMPVGTQGSVKALSPDDLKICGAEIILGNTYHLNLRPSSKLIKKLGGLHQFMGWDRPILTDSGGFQAFSLGAMIEHGVRKVPKIEKDLNKKTMGKINKNKTEVFNHSTVKTIREKSSGEGRGVLSKITDEGVLFISHLDGSKHLLTPQSSIGVQLELGSDIILCLDELLSPLHDKNYVKDSLERTHSWESGSQDFFNKNKKKSTNPHSQLFGILQGVFDQEIRQKEAKWIAEQGFDGISIGGSFGTSQYWGDEYSNVDWAELGAIKKTFEWVTPLLPEDLPRHALGIGEVQDFFECIERGVDMFDCVAPTRRARNGSLYICPKHGGKIANKFTLSIQKAELKSDPSPIDKDCLCYTCQNFSRAYLRHLYVSSEILYHRLATIHNVFFCVNLTKKIREAIINGEFSKLKNKWLK